MNEDLTPNPDSAPEQQPGAAISRDGAPNAGELNLELLMSVSLPVWVRFARTTILLHDAIHLGPGDLVPLARPLDAPVELIVDDKVVAQGEMVVVDGNYAIRIIRILTQEERLQTLQLT